MEALTRCVALALLIALASLAAAQVPIEVSVIDDVIRDGDGCSLREAVRCANGDTCSIDCTTGFAGLDIIEIPATLGTQFYLTVQDIGAQEDDALRGDLDIKEDLIIRGTFQGSGTPVLDAVGQFNHFDVATGVSLTLEEIDIVNGMTGLEGFGGAIRNRGNLRLRDVRLEDNAATNGAAGSAGGAIWASGPVHMDDCEVIGNSCTSAGGCAGGVLTFSGIVATNTVFRYNHGHDTVGETASGAVAVLDTATLGGSFSCELCDFEYNTGEYGGAVRVAEGSIYATGVSAIGNSATIAGGVFYAAHSIVVDGDRVVTNGVLQDNVATKSSGGVAYCEHGTVSLSSFSSVTGNSAYLFGGVAYAFADAHLIDVAGSVSDNSGTTGGGGVLYGVRVELSAVGGDVRNNKGNFGGVVGASDSAVVYDVAGSVSGNHATRSGGVLHANRRGELRQVGGSVVYNTAVRSGGVLHCLASCILDDVYVDVAENSAQSGGVVFGGSSQITNIIGDIRANSAIYYAISFGGNMTKLTIDTVGSIIDNYADTFLATATTIDISNVGGDIARNRCNTQIIDDDMFSASDRLRVSYIGGSISDNVSGGNIFRASNSGVEIEYVTGNISGNIGSIAASRTSIVIQEVTGDISNNRADFGAVAYTIPGFSAVPGSVQIRNVGSLSNNVATYSGGVVHSGTGNLVQISNVGDISNNVAATSSGGAVLCGGSVLVSNAGTIAGNESGGNGGLVSAGGDVEIRYALDISGNFAHGDGGVVWSDGALVALGHVQQIQQNVAEGNGGVAYATDNGTIRIYDAGDITLNHAVLDGGIANALQVSVASVGAITGNSAQSGGCVRAEQVYVRNVGDIGFNIATAGDGGCVSATGFELRECGAIYDNTSAGDGGFAHITVGAAIVENVYGSIERNRALRHGGVLYATIDSFSSIKYVYGGIQDNSAEESGGVLAGELVNIANVTGAIQRNYAGTGGVVYGDVVNIHTISGSISNNVADREGGVVYAFSSEEVDIQGVYEIVNNRACEGASSSCTGGGVVYHTGGPVRISDVGGRISGNSAGVGSGGVAYSNNGNASITILNCGEVANNSANHGGVALAANVIMNDIAGDIRDNTASGRGGVAYATNAVFIRNVFGQLSYNTGARGGVAFSEEYVRIEDVGAITFNHANEHGGVAFADAGATLRNVNGNIAQNSAGENGGVLYGAYNSLVVNVHGDIRFNTAGHSGGVVDNRGESVIISDIIGSVHSNIAGLRAEEVTDVGPFGGVVYSTGSVVLTNVSYDVRNNHVYGRQARGGVITSIVGNGIITNVGGYVCYNSAEEYGGVVYVSEFEYSADLVNVAGDVCHNNSGRGGVLHGSKARLEGIGGSVHNNVALSESDLSDDTVSGAVIQASGAAYVASIAGDLSYNRTNGNGGVINVSYGEGTVYDIGGSVVFNEGGVIVSNFDALLTHVAGSVSYNRSAAAAGVVRSLSGPARVSHVAYDVRGNSGETGVAVGVTAEISDIGGDVSYNTGSVEGGVAFSDVRTVLQRVSGSVVHNNANAGGVLVGIQEARISDVAGGIEHNEAKTSEGGVCVAGIACSITHIGGSVRYNRSYTQGGVASSGGGVVLDDVSGSIEHNQSLEGSGGVVFAATSVVVSNIGGAVQHNTAFDSGGVIDGIGSCELHTIGLGVSYNTATVGQGGVANCFYATLKNVGSGLIGNRAFSHGGVMATDGVGLVDNISGDVAGNVSGGSGGVVFSTSDEAEMSNIYGHVRENSATTGGVLSSNTASVLRDVTGDVKDNTATDLGGVLYAEGGYSHVTRVGNILRNSAGQNGGVVYSIEDATISDVGEITNNYAANGAVMYSGYAVISGSKEIRANFAYERGGVINAQEYCTIQDVGGDVAHNVAGIEGGVAICITTYLLAVDGNVEGNQADTGGVLYAYSHARIGAVKGSIRANTASRLYGGVAYVEGTSTIYNIEGDITLNSARYHGGVVYSLNESIIRDVNGDISLNRSEEGSGGVANGASVQISDIDGAVCGNYAGVAGGVAFGYSGTTRVATNGGSITDNEAGDGGVIYSFGDTARVDAGSGVVVGNSVPIATAGDTVLITGSYVGDSLPTLTVVTQPGNAIENEPLDPQPVLVAGAGTNAGLALPIVVTLIESDGTRTRLEGPFEVTYGATIQFHDLSVPVSGTDLSLEFAVAVVACGEEELTPDDSTAVSTDLFDVSECEFPHPLTCDADVSVGTEPFECQAFVTVAVPDVAHCSDVVFTSSVPISDGAPIAGQQFPLGTTVVTFDAAAGGEQDSCSLHVTVFDNEPPAIHCGATVHETASAGQCGARLALTPPTVSDNCDGANVQVTSNHPQTFFNVGTTNVVWTATDSAGLKSQCTQAVVVFDLEPPTITCPEDVILRCDSPPTFQEPAGSDNCPGVTTRRLTGPAVFDGQSNLPDGATTFTYEATDAVGLRATCSFTATTQSTWYVDADHDGVGRLGSQPLVQCPSPGPNYVEDKNYDCDDSNPLLGLLLFQDNDGDTWGNANAQTCSEWTVLQSMKRSPEALVVRAGDCDDTNPDVNPGMLEVCFNRIDDNCNGEIDENCPLTDSSYSIPTIPSSTIPFFSEDE